MMYYKRILLTCSAFKTCLKQVVPAGRSSNFLVSDLILLEGVHFRRGRTVTDQRTGTITLGTIFFKLVLTD